MLVVVVFLMFHRCAPRVVLVVLRSTCLLKACMLRWAVRLMGSHTVTLKRHGVCVSVWNLNRVDKTQTRRIPCLPIPLQTAPTAARTVKEHVTFTLHVFISPRPRSANKGTQRHCNPVDVWLASQTLNWILNAQIHGTRLWVLINITANDC